jgi:hypothetical protein
MKRKPSKNRQDEGGKQLVSFLGYSPALKMETVRSTETSVDFYPTT